MGDTPEIKDKIFFSVSFLTLLVTVAVSGYKDYLNQIIIVNLFAQGSLFNLLILIAIFLFLSVYFSALENLTNFKINVSHFKDFSIFKPLANLFYWLSILAIPLTIFVYYFLSTLFYISLAGVNFLAQKTPFISLLSSLSNVLHTLNLRTAAITTEVLLILVLFKIWRDVRIAYREVYELWVNTIVYDNKKKE